MELELLTVQGGTSGVGLAESPEPGTGRRAPWSEFVSPQEAGVVMYEDDDDDAEDDEDVDEGDLDADEAEDDDDFLEDDDEDADGDDALDDDDDEDDDF